MATAIARPEAAVPLMGRSDLPQEIQDILKEPLPAEAIGKHPRINGLSSIKAAFVIERLNKAFGNGGWDDKATIIDRSTRTEVWGEGTPKEKTVTLHVATVHLVFTVEKYGIHKENFGGSDNVDLGDALKGARTDALTKIASELGVGLEIYKGRSGESSGADALPACPNCGKMLRKSKEKDELYCWVKKDGCGATFTEEGLKAAIANKTKPVQSAKQEPRNEPTTVAALGKFTISNIVEDKKSDNGTLWLKVGARNCATKQPEIMNALTKAHKGSIVELLVSELSGKDGAIYQIHKVIGVKEGGRQ